MFVDFKPSRRPASDKGFPTLGRFVEPDPIGYEGGLNLYAYVGNDPVNFTDPMGLVVTIPCPAGNVCWTATIPRDKPPPDTRKPMPDAPRETGSEGGSSEIVVTAKKLPKSKWDKFKDCAAAQYGFGDGDTPTGLDFGKQVSEVGALPIPKRLVGVPVIGNSSRVTNAVSLIPHKLGIRLNIGKQVLGSARLFGALGRANAIVGGVLLAWDATSIAICTAKD